MIAAFSGIFNRVPCGLVKTAGESWLALEFSPDNEVIKSNDETARQVQVFLHVFTIVTLL